MRRGLRVWPGMRSERGQVFVMVAVLLPVLIGMAGLVTDVGYWYVSKRKAQLAADAGALAAAFELPDPALAGSVGRTYVDENVDGSTTLVTTPYKADANKVEVRVAIERGAFFSKLFGIDSIDIEARAVAAKLPGGAKMVIYNHGEDCQNEYLKLDGNNFVIDGAVHTNGKVIVSGNQREDPDNIDVLTYATGTSGNCSPEISDNRPNRVNADGPVPARTWPVVINSASYVPSRCSAGFTNLNTDRTWAPSHNGKVICARSYKFDLNNTTANVTVFACRKIEVGGNLFTITPVLDGIVMASISRGPSCGSGFANNDVFTINGNNGTINGIIWNEKNLIKYNGNSASVFEGQMLGNQVLVNGNSFTMKGTGASSGTGGIALLE